MNIREKRNEFKQICLYLFGFTPYYLDEYKNETLYSNNEDDIIKQMNLVHILKKYLNMDGKMGIKNI